MWSENGHGNPFLSDDGEGAVKFRREDPPFPTPLLAQIRGMLMSLEGLWMGWFPPNEVRGRDVERESLTTSVHLFSYTETEGNTDPGVNKV